MSHNKWNFHNRQFATLEKGRNLGLVPQAAARLHLSLFSSRFCSGKFPSFVLEYFHHIGETVLSRKCLVSISVKQMGKVKITPLLKTGSLDNDVQEFSLV